MPLYPNRVDTVGDLIAALSDYDPDIPIRWAAQPSWAMAYTIGPVVCTPDDADDRDSNHDNSLGDNATSHTADSADNESESDGPVVWLGEGEPIGYLPGAAASALGWS